MRVLHLVQKPQRRGAEVFASQLSTWLREQSHEVRTVYLYPLDGGTPLEISPGDVVAAGRERSVLERVTGIHPQLLGCLRRTVCAFAPDIVQTNGARSLKYGAALTHVDRRRRWRLIYRNIDRPAFWVRGLLRATYYRRVVMPRVDGVISVSSATLAEARTFYGLNVPSISVPNGVDLNSLVAFEARETVRARYTTPPQAIVLLFSGHVGVQKRVDRFLRVAAAIARSSAEAYAWVLGDGPDIEKSRQLAADLGVAHRVRFLGCHASVASVVAASDIHLSTSDTEGMPAAVIEAAHLRVPTVAFRVGGVQECIAQGQTGLLVRAGDEAELGQAVLWLVKSPSWRAAMGEAAHRWVHSRFSIDVVGRQYESFYQRVLAEAS